MLSISDKFPEFKLEATKNGEIQELSSSDLLGNWTIIFFYPEDYSFICPTEVKGFENHREEIEEMDANLIGVSVDDIDLHVKWSQELGINYLLVSDIETDLSRAVGVLDNADGRAHRSTFILDPELTVQFAMVSSRNIGRSVYETMRVFRAIQTGKKCPADYDATKME